MKAELKRRHYSVTPEDLFDLVGVGGEAPDTDARVTVAGEFRAAETERVGRFRKEGRNRDGMNVRFPKSQNQAMLAERFFEAKEFEVVAIDGRELLGGVLQGEGQDRDLGAFNVFGEIGIGAFGSETAFFAGDNLGRILDPVQDTSPTFCVTLSTVIDAHESLKQQQPRYRAAEG